MSYKPEYKATHSLPFGYLETDSQCTSGLRKRYSDSIQAGRSGDRTPLVARYSAPVQTGPEAHPASYTMGTRYSAPVQIGPKAHPASYTMGTRYSTPVQTGPEAHPASYTMGTRYSPPVQTGPEAHPASYTMGTRSFPEVTRPGHGVDHPPSSSAEVKGRVELYLCSPCGPSWPVLE